MQDQTLNMTDKQLARLTGVFYLLIIAAGLYSGIAIRGVLVDFNDPLVTTQAIVENEGLYRVGFMSDLIMVISDVVVSVLFFFLLRTVNFALAVFAAVFRLIQSSILGANLINLFSPLVLIAGFPGAESGTQDFIVSSVIQSLNLFEYGYLISGVFFSINCLLMGVLLYRATFIPKLWGIAIGVAGIAYLSNCLANFLVPSFAEFTQLFVMIAAIFAELGLCLYLLVVGTRSYHP